MAGKQFNCVPCNNFADLARQVGKLPRKRAGASRERRRDLGMPLYHYINPPPRPRRRGSVAGVIGSRRRAVGGGVWVADGDPIWYDS